MTKDITSIDHVDDDKDYEKLDKVLTETTINRKQVLIKGIDIEGQKLLDEIDKKNKKIAKKRQEYIHFILVKSKDNELDEDELKELDIKELKPIYEKAVYDNRPFIKRFFEFIFFK